MWQLRMYACMHVGSVGICKKGTVIELECYKRLYPFHAVSTPSPSSHLWLNGQRDFVFLCLVCVRACVRVCVRACVLCVYVRACVHVCNEQYGICEHCFLYLDGHHSSASRSTTTHVPTCVAHYGKV